MTKVIDKIIIKNSFAHIDTTINFTDGINYIIGPEGSGKSEILEMIGFCFFGVCALRDKSTSYKKLEVSLYFNYLNEKFLLERKINDAKLKLFNEKSKTYSEIVVGTTPVNNKIITLFGYDYTIYELSNYCAQGELQSFSKMTPAKKIAFIDKVSGIEEAKSFLKFLEDNKKSFKKEIESLQKYVIKPELKDNSLLDVPFDILIAEKEQQKFNSISSLTAKINLEKLVNKLEFDFNYISKNNTNLYNTYKDLIDNFKNKDECIQFINKFNDLKTKDSHLSSIKKVYNIPDNWYKYTYKDILEHKAALEYNDKVKLKNQLLKNQTIECPSCTHTFSTSYKELSQYVDIGNSFKSLIFDSRLNLELLENFYKNEIKSFEENTQLLIRENYQDLSKKYFCLNNFNILSDINTYFSNLDNLTSIETELKSAKEELESTLEYLDSNNLNSITIDIEKLQSDKYSVEIYKTSLEMYNKAFLEMSYKKEEINKIDILISKVKEISLKIKSESIPLINYHASSLINSMTDSIISNITITENYDILVDGKSINLCSGSEKDTASLAFRLSLGNSIILGMLPLFIGDEIDSACKVERATLITDVLKNTAKDYQVILITHKDTDNFDDCNIINLEDL